MTKSKSDLLKTSENRRVSPYGEYYISVKKIEVLRNEREDCESLYFRLPYPQLSFGYPMLIKAIFESDKEYFGKTSKERWVHNIPLSTNSYTISRSIYHFDISIYFPSLTTLNIIKGKRFIRILLEDVEICDALVCLLNTFSIKVSGNRPISALESFLKRQIPDIETRLKLQIDYPIAFEDIEGAHNLEVREQALRKFGYEKYIKEGFKKKRIQVIHYDDGSSFAFHFDTPENRMWYKTLEYEKYLAVRNNDEKIICFRSDITFLQVKDSTTNKTYFLKVPPTMRSVKEAKAWTFGLNPGEYNPTVET